MTSPISPNINISSPSPQPLQMKKEEKKLTAKIVSFAVGLKEKAREDIKQQMIDQESQGFSLGEETMARIRRVSEAQAETMVKTALEEALQYFENDPNEEKK
jgi:hypothetical protein